MYACIFMFFANQEPFAKIKFLLSTCIVSLLHLNPAYFKLSIAIVTPTLQLKNLQSNECLDGLGLYPKANNFDIVLFFFLSGTIQLQTVKVMDAILLHQFQLVLSLPALPHVENIIILTDQTFVQNVFHYSKLPDVYDTTEFSLLVS